MNLLERIPSLWMSTAAVLLLIPYDFGVLCDTIEVPANMTCDTVFVLDDYKVGVFSVADDDNELCRVHDQLARVMAKTSGDKIKIYPAEGLADTDSDRPHQLPLSAESLKRFLVIYHHQPKVQFRYSILSPEQCRALESYRDSVEFACKCSFEDGGQVLCKDVIAKSLGPTELRLDEDIVKTSPRLLAGALSISERLQKLSLRGWYRFSLSNFRVLFSKLFESIAKYTKV